MQYIRRENNPMVMIVFLTIETHHYQTRTDRTLASWTTYREYKDETIGKSWTVNDIIKCCENTLNRFEKIVDVYVIGIIIHVQLGWQHVRVMPGVPVNLC